MIRSLLCSLAFIACCAHAQSVTDILERHRKAAMDPFDTATVKTIVTTGEMCMQQKLCLPLTLWLKLPDHMRIEMEFNNLKFLMVTADSLTWQYDPFNEKTSVTRVSTEADGSDPFQFINQDLIGYPQNGYSIKLQGKERLDSLEVYVLNLRKKNSRKKIYINTTTYLINKTVSRHDTTYFLDYEFRDNLVYPRLILHSSEKEQLRMRFTTCRFNEPVADSLFVIPDDVIRKYYHSDPTSPDARFESLMQQGNDYYKRQMPDSALMVYNEVIRLDPSSDRAFNGRGMVKLAQEKYYDAISDFTRALELNEHNANALNNRGFSKYKLNDHTGAMADYNLAIAADTAMVIARTNRGLVYLTTERHKEAYNDFSFAVAREPQTAHHYYNRALALVNLKNYAEAVADLRECLDRGLHTADVYNYKGVSEYNLELYDSALTSFDKAVALKDDALQYRKNLAHTYYQLERYEEAGKHLEECLRLSPEDDALINMIGLCQYFQEHYKGAIKNFSKAIDINPKNAVYFDNRAEAKQHIDDYAGAIKDYDQSIKLYPNDPSTFYKRGMVKILTSKKYEGCLDLATANEMEYEPAREAIMENCH